MRTFFLAVLAVSFCSCSLFQREPPLPRRAVVEARGSEEKFAALIQDADIIYFPTESVALQSRSDAAWRLLETLRGRGGSFAIGWDWTGNDGDHRNYLDAATRSGAEILPLGELNADQLVADQIATYFREHHNDKTLVFLRRSRLAMDQGVPYLVAQKTKARQLILNPKKHSESRTRLLASR